MIKSLEHVYDIPMTEEMEGEVEQMCNLSDGVERKGIEQGTWNTLCSLVYDNILSIEEAAKRAELSVEKFTIKFNNYKNNAKGNR